MRLLARFAPSVVPAVCALSLSIAATVTIFSVTDFVFRESWSFPSPENLVLVSAEGRETRRESPISRALFYNLREKQTVFSELAADDWAAVEITGLGDPFVVFGARVTPNYFQTLGVKPGKGRSFRADDESGASVAIVSDNFWRVHLDAAPDVLGRSLLFGGVAHTVIGVLPPVSAYALGTLDVWTTSAPPTPNSSEGGRLGVLGRLRDGVSLASAQAELERLQAQWATAEDRAEGLTTTLRVKRLIEVRIGHLRPSFDVLLYAVVGLLLLGCSNAANLLVARFAARRREMAIRMALGSSRGAILRRLVGESVGIAAVSAGLGFFVARGILKLLPPLAPDVFPAGTIISATGPVLVFAVALALAVGIGAGWFPAWRASRVDIVTGLKNGGSTFAGDSGAETFRQVLVGAQAAISFLLLAGASLLLVSFQRLSQQDPGFRAEGVCFGTVVLSSARFPDLPSRLHFVGRLLDEMRVQPGIEAAMVSDSLPLTGSPFVSYARADQPLLPEDRRARAPLHHISTGYFNTLGIPLQAGREFTEGDEASSAVTIISRLAAETLFPGENPLGQLIVLGTSAAEIIGVAGDTRSVELARVNGAEFYLPLGFETSSYLLLVVRAKPGLDASGAMRHVLRRADSSLSLNRPAFLNYFVEGSISRPKMLAILVGGFAFVALLLAVVGIYAVVASSVARRTREIGIRSALGATRSQLIRLTLSRGMKPVWMGTGAGIAVALVLGRFLASELYQIAPYDPTLLALNVFLLCSIGTVACLIPACSAVRMNPVEALRAE